MTAGATINNAESDPVAVALANPEVIDRLNAATYTFLTSHLRRAFAIRLIAEAERVVSEARARAWAKRGEYDRDRDVVCWLVGFVINAAREFVREFDRDARTTPATAVDLENLEADACAPVDALEDAEQREQLARVRAGLTLDENELLRLVYEEGLTFPEIGVRIGIDENTARTRHHRLIHRLRRLTGASEEGRL